ncbi:uncharacterized protein LY89DRAFT_680019 [Mollisia scopiformis]|uniref:Uncharacterized protein n=1 Tax=Mollisia scopiformis TaxID=149040 RepID=A0A194XSQ9_MOLSC|nr:uncharacterized protein LY89DRAFT_680019 [Mollisia scopiformis]KUJ23233.1 hypothetical protein LY89DRAFT_680019 [Mollisia scopiformis]
MGRRRNSQPVKSLTGDNIPRSSALQIDRPKDNGSSSETSRSNTMPDVTSPHFQTQHADIMQLEFDCNELNDFFYTYPSIETSSCQSPSSLNGNSNNEDPWAHLDIDFTNASLISQSLQTQQQELDQLMTDCSSGLVPLETDHQDTDGELSNCGADQFEHGKTPSSTNLSIKGDATNTHSSHGSSTSLYKSEIKTRNLQHLSSAVVPFTSGHQRGSSNHQDCTCYNSVLRNLASSNQDNRGSAFLAADIVLKIEHETQSILTELMKCRSCSQDGSALLLSFINVSKTLDLLESTASLEMKPQRRASVSSSRAAAQIRTSQAIDARNVASAKRCSLQVGSFEVMDGGRSRFLRKIFQSRLKQLQMRLRSLHLGLGNPPQDCITRAGLVMVTGILRRLQTFTGRLELWDEQS